RILSLAEKSQESLVCSAQVRFEKGESMKLKLAVLHRLNPRLELLLLVLSAILAFAAPSRASTVGCAGASGGPFDYPTLTAALSAPGALANNVILVSGACTEAVVISGAQNLQIAAATAGAALVDPGGSPANFGAVLEIDNSQVVQLVGMTIQ